VPLREEDAMGPRMGITKDHEANNTLRLNDDSLAPRTVRTRQRNVGASDTCVRIRPPGIAVA
jgi:hypothetical protein